MNVRNTIQRATLIAASLLLVSFASSYAAESEFKFKVHNTTKNSIKKVLVSEDGKEFGNFDIGKGIKPGPTMELIWDSSTNSESCHPFFKAEFDDGSESEPVKFIRFLRSRSDTRLLSHWHSLLHGAPSIRSPARSCRASFFGKKCLRLSRRPNRRVRS